VHVDEIKVMRNQLDFIFSIVDVTLSLNDPEELKEGLGTFVVRGAPSFVGEGVAARPDVKMITLNQKFYLNNG
jgi:hypothetical protein